MEIQTPFLPSPFPYVAFYLSIPWYTMGFGRLVTYLRSTETQGKTCGEESSCSKDNKARCKEDTSN
jgi:hypothetical protein